MEGKLFFMTVDYRDGAYRVRWRQIDGAVQRLGPTYGLMTPDRLWLAKAICTAVKQDFAPVAVVEPGRDDRQIRLDFQGADLGDRLAQWLEGGCVHVPPQSDPVSSPFCTPSSQAGGVQALLVASQTPL